MNDFIANNLIEEIVIEKLIFGGYGMGFSSKGVPTFILGAYPGEVVKVEIFGDKGSFCYGKILDFIHKSANRNSPLCSVYNECGGCHWLDFDYSCQLEWKKKILIEQFSRIAKIDVSDSVAPVISCDSLYGFRNKMEYEFALKDGRVILGLKKENSREVVKTKGCKIVPNEFERIVNSLLKLLNASDNVVSVYDRKSKKGILKNLVIRKSNKDNQIMVIFCTHTQSYPNLKSISQDLVNACPFISSVIHVKNSSDSVVLRGPYSTIIGDGVLYEHLQGFDYQIPPTAFFQTNVNVVEKILLFLRENIINSDNKSLLDLFCGVGLFSIYFSPLFKNIDAVENNSVSIKAFNRNKNINKISQNFGSNINIFEEDVEKFLLINSKNYSSIILDPPRSGLNDNMRQAILRKNAHSLYYVSCDLSTLARDCAFFVKNAYSIRSIQAFDMFPHTYHLECIVVLDRV